MDARSVILMLGALGSCGVALAAGCTEPFYASGTGASSTTAGSAGSAGTGATSTKTSATGSSAVSSSGAAQACTTEQPGACAPGTYCRIPACKNSGTCAPAGPGADGGAFAPVCSCDGVTYWNGLLAAEASAVVRGEGPCDAEGETCDAGSNTCKSFGTRGFCNITVDGGTACAIGSLTGGQQGTCWVLPACMGVPGAPNTGYACAGTGQCKTACALVESQLPWYEASCMP